MLAEAEASKTSSFASQRDYQSITLGARAELLKLLQYQHPNDCETEVKRIISGFENASDQNPDDPGLAAIAARAHLDVGWAWRGDGFADQVTEGAWAKMAFHYGEANARISSFMKNEVPASLSIARAAHEVARHLEDDGRQMRKVYEFWREMDPGNPDIYSEHGFHLLPRWCGSYEDLAREAQRASAAHVDTIGTAPYLWMYWPSIECDAEALIYADLDLLRQSVRDHLALDSSSMAVNQILSTFTELWLSRPLNAVSAKKTRHLRDFAEGVCQEIVRTRLTTVCTEVWDELEQVAGVIATTYADEIDQGYHIEMDGSGFRFHLQGAEQVLE